MERSATSCLAAAAMWSASMPAAARSSSGFPELGSSRTASNATCGGSSASANAASTASPAQEATPDMWMSATASKSRADVRDELQQARRDGSIRFGAVDYDWAGRVVSEKTRGQVHGELLAALDSGEYAMINDEVHGFSLPQTPRYAKAPR